MLRPILILACCAVALAPAAGCKKSGSSQPPGYPADAPTASVPSDPATREKLEAALDNSGVTEEQRAEILSELAKQGPKYDLSLSEDQAFLVHKGEAGQGTPIEAVLFEISNLKNAEPSVPGQVRLYLETRQEQIEVSRKQAEELRSNLERIDKGEITAGLYPAANPTGDWHSIGETREGEKHFLVEHDDMYYKQLRVNSETKTLQILEFKEGQLERDLSLPYEYAADSGQLTTTSAGGGPGDAFIVMELQNVPDRLFVRPMYDTVFAFTVYRRSGKNPANMEAPRPVATPAPKGAK